MTNCSPDGIRYSYFSFNELADWCNQDLFYGDHARDLSYEAALEELKADGGRQYDEWLEDAEIAACEVDANMSPNERHRLIERFFKSKNSSADREDFISDWVEEMAENTQIDEPIVEGTLDGVSYRTSWLGGAPHIFVFKGPLGYGNRLCSPCVPGAVDPSGGFTLTSELAEGQEPEGYLCYCVPRDWLREAE